MLTAPFRHVRYITTQFNVFQVTDTPGDDIERRLGTSVDRHVDSVTKYNYALHRILAGRFNFTYVRTYVKRLDMSRAQNFIPQASINIKY